MFENRICRINIINAQKYSCKYSFLNSDFGVCLSFDMSFGLLIMTDCMPLLQTRLGLFDDGSYDDGISDDGCFDDALPMTDFMTTRFFRRRHLRRQGSSDNSSYNDKVVTTTVVPMARYI